MEGGGLGWHDEESHNEAAEDSPGSRRKYKACDRHQLLSRSLLANPAPALFNLHKVERYQLTTELLHFQEVCVNRCRQPDTRVCTLSTASEAVYRDDSISSLAPYFPI